MSRVDDVGEAASRVAVQGGQGAQLALMQREAGGLADLGELTEGALGSLLRRTNHPHTQGGCRQRGRCTVGSWHSWL